MASDGRGWFQTLEFPRSTAILVQAEKEKKYATSLKELSNGNCVVLYRGRNQSELEDIKEKRKIERQKLAREKNKGFHKRNA